MSMKIAPLVNLEDVALEREIAVVRDLMVKAIRSDVKRIYANAMRELIELRSPEQVERMEKAKGF